MTELCEPGTVTITGSRTNHPRHGASSDIVVIADGLRYGPFAFYRDAYAFALETTRDPDKIRRNGRKARKP